MKVTPGSIYTMNDLDESELNTKKQEFISNNINTLGSYFSSMDIQKLKNTFLSKFFGRVTRIKLRQDQVEESVFRFSKKCIIIPKTLNLVSGLLVENKVSTSGVFRVNSVPENIKSFLSVVDSIAEGRISLDLGLKMINHAFDIIDISESYKMLFRKCGGPIIPSFFLNMAVAINDSVNPEHKKICCRAILFALPRSNRMILENCAYLCTIMASKFQDSSSSKHMNIVGLGVVMTPNLIDFSVEDFEFDFVKKLSQFVCFLFENFEEIIKIS